MKIMKPTISPSSSSHTTIIFYALVMFLATVSSSYTGNETDHLALLSFKSMITKDPYGALTSWNSSFHLCDWSGVLCGKRHKRVTVISLESQGLEGSLSPYVGNLSFLQELWLYNNSFEGIIPHEVGRLFRVRYLGLDNNKFNGTIPTNLSGCSNLKELYLSDNKLVGSIPKEIIFLLKLTFVAVHYNRLTGGIPSFLGNITSMEVFSAMGNPWGGNIPDTLGNWKSLRELYLGECNLYGTIPTNLSGCSNLKELYLSDNKLVGSIPKEIIFLLKLTSVSVHNNMLTGGIPSFLGNITSMEVFSAMGNPWGGNIPDTLGNWKNLRDLYLGECNLYGTIPHSLYNLSFLTEFSLDDNKLTGSLPTTFGVMLPHLTVLQLRVNQLTGPIPPSISNCSNLEIIELQNNSFSGKLTIDFSKLSDISQIHLFENNFDGLGDKFIDSMKNCSNLESLDLSSCKLQGGIPISIGNLSHRLRYLNLGENQLHGNLPSSIGNLVGLMRINLESNQFTGELPSTIGMLQNLQPAYFDDNQFSGPIPDAIGNLSKLIILSLASNNLEGNIPLSLGNCHQLTKLFLSYNKLSGKIPKQLLQLTSLSIVLDLSHNNLVGVLPPEIGDLMMLSHLDLSNNNLSGNIPSTIGGCTSLSILFIDRNLFQGIIPPSLSSLRGMMTLDLSHNNFSGIILPSLSSMRGMLELDLSNNNFSGQIPKFLEEFPLTFMDLTYNDFEGEVPVLGVFANESAFWVSNNSRLCGGLVHLGLPKCQERKKHIKRLPWFIILILIVSTIITIFCIIYAWFKKKRNDQVYQSSTNGRFSKISYTQLLKATNGFSEDNLIGKGGFSSVYKGILDQDDKFVAVKVLHLKNRGADRSFKAECEVWRSIRHRNLLKIITSCSSVDYQGNDFKALVYEFMSNGSLHDWLHSSVCKSQLDLVQRINILINVACALDYLHNHCPTTIVHGDLKPSNILLDDDMVAHVGDFGLARFLGMSLNQSSSIGIRGTIGYAPPEYGLGSEMTSSGDVYSFGISLLEVMTRKKPTDDIFNEGLSLHKFVYTALENHVIDAIDGELLKYHHKDAIAMKSIALTLKIGVSCSVDLPSHRPNIKNVVNELQHILDAIQTI